MNIIQGPLAGISSAPFRLITAQYGTPAFAYTEMVSCKTLIHSSKKAVSPFLRKLPGEGPLGVQLSGSCPRELSEAVKIATDCGADLIDLNCGCPVKKVRRRGAGSALLSEPRKLYELILAMRQSTALPVSAKIRVDGASGDNFNQEIAQAVSDAGLDFLTVHGRHWNTDYEETCLYDQIRFFVAALNIPVIGNGDVACGSTLAKMFATGCAGIMVSRAGVGQPWFFKNLVAAAAGEPASCPSPREIGDIFLQHVRLLAEFSGSEVSALRQARTFCRYYARSMPQREMFCTEVIRCTRLETLHILCENYFSG